MQRPHHDTTAIFHIVSLLLLSSLCTLNPIQAFAPSLTKQHHHPSFITTSSSSSKRTSLSSSTTSSPFSPSKVQDDDGPTPEQVPDEPIEITQDSLPELNYDENAHPVPHQPWRRGNTDGCDDPIEAPWRIEAEDIIRLAVSSVGAAVADVTWYMAAVVVTLEEDEISNADGETGEMEVRVQYAGDNVPQYYDPDDPEPEDDYGWYEGEEDGRLVSSIGNSNSDGADEDDGATSMMANDPYAEREFDEATGTYLPPPPRPTREAAVRNINHEEFEKYLANGMEVDMTDIDERIKNKLSMEEFQIALEELREAEMPEVSIEEMERKAKTLRARFLKSEDLRAYYPEEFAKVGFEEPLGEKLAMPNLERADGVDAHSLTVIAKAIVDALEDEAVEEKLQVLSRHEVILTSPGDEELYVETQRQFDAMRGEKVLVQTQDPFGSNRVLAGRLVDRNALDVIINVKGRMVTIPQNMVAYVEISRDNNEYEYE